MHSCNEITFLANHFPEYIQLYVTKHEHVIIAGTLLFISEKVVHTQYIASNFFSKKNGGLDILFDYLMNQIFPHVRFF